MQIVIEIVDDDYNRINSYPNGNTFYPITARLYKAVKDGTPLPKHGRLIDAGEYIDVLNNAQIEGLNTYKGLGRAKELLIDAPTIIEAERSEE